MDHLYSTRFSDNSFQIYDFNLKLTSFAIDFRGPKIWNKFLTEREKSCTSIDVFKNKIKSKILFFSNKFLFFSIDIDTCNSVFLLYKTKHFSSTLLIINM